ncbi:MAG TPA: YbaN family protein [Hyphomonas sp.]|nr:DUF454 domain-containing protein [Hyphomonas sp.]HRJ01949.1 YbaN family protein [Hyphomonas sp.]HRK67199.1 YbaN family protein [Hyphomonas sp.]
MTPRRAAWFTLGIISLGLGAIGVVVPLLPTTPFILLAAFAFSRSSDRWHAWLIHHRTFGPLIADWRAHGAINRRTKIASSLAMAAVLAISLALAVPWPVFAVQVLVLAAVAAFIWSRPTPPAQS